MAEPLARQARRLHDVFSELIRRYQFRDRDQVVCHGLSISQCYALQTLAQQRSLTTGELAEHLCLKISTLTRVVDHLVRTGLATRAGDASDRRICRVEITQRGRALVASIRKELVQEYAGVLRTVPAESRAAVIEALSSLLTAFKARPSCRSAVAAGEAPRRRRAVLVKRS
jgi:MarR family transcriptional regulator, 2-MHQ and catechol-resistance regulon repressor